MVEMVIYMNNTIGYGIGTNETIQYFNIISLDYYAIIFVVASYLGSWTIPKNDNFTVVLVVKSTSWPSHCLYEQVFWQFMRFFLMDYIC